MATKKMLTIPGQDLVLPTQLPGDVTPKRMIGNPTFTPDGKQITGGSGVTYSLKDMGGQDTPYTTTEVVGVKGGPTPPPPTPPRTETLEEILAQNAKSAVAPTPVNKLTTPPPPTGTKLLAQAGGQSNSLPGAISPEDKIPGVYYPTPLPTPNTPTPTNPVVKNSLQKAPEVAPDMAQIQQMDINNLNDTIDKLQIKQSKEQLSDEELLTLRRATRQLQQSMTPQSLTGGLDKMIAKKETNITETTNKLDKQNEQELAQFKQSQEVYKQAEIQAIEQADEEQKKTLGYILGAQGAGTSSFGAEQINKITQNSLQKKQVLAQAVQAKIDLYGSQLRKDSQETIQTLQTNLDNLYMKAAEFDVENIKELNAFNKEQGANKIKEIDDMLAFAQQQQKLALPLTEAEKQQANAFAANLYDNEGNFDDKTFELLQKINPKLAMEAVLQGGSIQKERMSNDLAMKGLDADIKRAQLNKLLNPNKEYDYKQDKDGNRVAIDKNDPTKQIPIGGRGQGNPIISDPTVQTSIAQYSQQQRGRATLQCGELVNDYIKKETGSRGSLGNSFADKVAGIEDIGRSASPVVGGVFAFDIKTSQGNTGHTGIVTGVNPDGSITVLEANRKENSANGGVPSQGTYTPAQVKNMVFSQAPTNKGLMMEAQSLVAGMGGTGEERNQYAKNLIQVAQEKGISVKDAKAELGLRTKTDDDFIKQRTDQYGDLRDAGSALSQVRSAIDLLNDPNGTNDLIGIVGLLKSIDPRSVARSDEVDNVANARSVIASMEVKLNKLKSGELLNPDQRKQLQKSMQTMVNAYEKKNTDFKKTVIKDFDTRGLDSNILFGSEDVQAGRSGIANEIALQAGGAGQSTNTTSSNQGSKDADLDKFLNI